MQFIETVDNKLINLRYIELVEMKMKDDIYMVQVWIIDYNASCNGITGEWRTIYSSKNKSVISYAFRQLRDVLVYHGDTAELMTQEEIEDANN